jgi:carboxyl-terminal processing protease
VRTAALVTAFLLVLTGGIWLGGHPEALPGAVRDALVEEGPAVRANVIDSIERRFYRPVSRAKLEEESLRGMVASLNDPYSRYFSPKEAKSFNEDLSGKFEGVGMSVHPSKEGLVITDTFEGAPARKAGMRAGDVITHVNGKSIAGKPINSATDTIKGPPGTFVNLTVKRDGKKLRFHVERAKIDIPAVEGKIVRHDGKKFALVSLSSFSSGVHGQLRQEIDKQLKAGAKGIVLDLRGNPGGLLREGVMVSSIFINDGTIVTTKGRSEPKRVYKAEGDSIASDIPVVVLVDRGTASSSEITTGALKDRGRATVVGTRTFGKGVFQEVESLKNGGALDLTVGRYYLPNNEPLPKGGITPQVRAVDNPKTPKKDEALPIALDALTQSLK